MVDQMGCKRGIRDYPEFFEKLGGGDKCLPWGRVDTDGGAWFSLADQLFILSWSSVVDRVGSAHVFYRSGTDSREES